MAFLVPWKCGDCKFVGNSSPYSSLWLARFPVAKIPKAQWDRERIMNTIMRFLLYMDNQIPFVLRISTNKRNSILVHFVDWHFHALQTLVNQWLSNYHVNMISSNILTSGFFFSEHRLFDTLWFQLHYSLTP